MKLNTPFSIPNSKPDIDNAKFCSKKILVTGGSGYKGIILIKLYFSVSKKMQLKRFEKRAKDPLKQYKLSPVDMQAQELWGEYTMRKFQMLLETNTSLSPWTVIRSDNKKRARINCMKYVLSKMDYEGKIDDSELSVDPKIVISGIDEIKLMEGNLAKPHKLPG